MSKFQIAVARVSVNSDDDDSQKEKEKILTVGRRIPISQVLGILDAASYYASKRRWMFASLLNSTSAHDSEQFSL